jgi:hypothetical protein
VMQVTCVSKANCKDTHHIRVISKAPCFYIIVNFFENLTIPIGPSEIDF